MRTSNAAMMKSLLLAAACSSSHSFHARSGHAVFRVSSTAHPMLGGSDYLSSLGGETSGLSTPNGVNGFNGANGVVHGVESVNGSGGGKVHIIYPGNDENNNPNQC